MIGYPDAWTEHARATSRYGLAGVGPLASTQTTGKLALDFLVHLIGLWLCVHLVSHLAPADYTHSRKKRAFLREMLATHPQKWEYGSRP